MMMARLAQPPSGTSCPVEACRSWVDSMVIGLSLCPWAKPVRDSGGLRYSLTTAREAETLSAALLHEIYLLQTDPEIETTILVHPHVFADDFLGFTQYTQTTEAWMQDEGLVDEFQLVGFHPAHQFMNEEKDDAGNVRRHAATHGHTAACCHPPTAIHRHPYRHPSPPIATHHNHRHLVCRTAVAVAQFANRSPFPMIHLLRQDSVTEAVDDHPNSVAIAQANARLLRGLGTERLEEMVGACTLATATTTTVDTADPG